MKQQQQNRVEFKVEVNDVITPSSCSAMIVEFVKYIVYQKQIIPYPFERLKMYVNKRKKQLSADSEPGRSGPDSRIRAAHSKESLISHKYFKKVEAAYDSLENMFKTITNELTNANCNDCIEEIVLLLGTSFTNPQDIYRLCIPRLNYAHSVKYHSTQKNWRNLFRTMINSEKFNDIVCGSSCSGNLHILLKMRHNDDMLAGCSRYNKDSSGGIVSHSLTDANQFIPRNGFKVPTRGNHAVITFETENVSSDCSCFDNDFKIFQDNVDAEPSLVTSVSTSKNERANDMKFSCDIGDFSRVNECRNDGNSWFQIKDTLKYFADVTLNDVSLTDMWMNPNVANI